MKRYNVELFVIVPTACLHVPEVEDALKAITVRAGGVTITETRGMWYDDDGNEHYDRGSRYSWCMNTSDRNHLGVLRPLEEAMKAAGEKAVMFGARTLAAYIV